MRWDEYAQRQSFSWYGFLFLFLKNHTQKCLRTQSSHDFFFFFAIIIIDPELCWEFVWRKVLVPSRFLCFGFEIAMDDMRMNEQEWHKTQNTHIKLLIDPKLSIKHMALREAFSYSTRCVCVRVCAAVFSAKEFYSIHNTHRTHFHVNVYLFTLIKLRRNQRSPI